MKTYIKPLTTWAQVETEAFIAASPTNTPNRVTDDGGGTYTGGTSRPGESTNEDPNGNVEDMSKKHGGDIIIGGDEKGWDTWD